MDISASFPYLNSERQNSHRNQVQQLLKSVEWLLWDDGSEPDLTDYHWLLSSLFSAGSSIA